MRQSTNGHTANERFPLHQNVAVAGTRMDVFHAPQPYAFTANDIERIGYCLRLYASTHVLALGTTGSRIAHELVKKLLKELGSNRLPAGFNYLMVDAAAPHPGMDQDHFHRLAGGLNGAGTDPKRGFDLFCTVETYEQLRFTLGSHVVDFGRSDPELPCCVPPREAVDFWIIGGCGGTSGGALDPAIKLIHDVAQQRNIQHPRVNVLLIGAEISLGDRTRSVTTKQQQVVRATAAGLVCKLAGDMANSQPIDETRPDGTSFSVSSSDRVWSLLLADQTNGQADCSTVDGLIRVVVEALFPRLFTMAGIHLGDRFKDFVELGSTGRGQL